MSAEQKYDCGGGGGGGGAGMRGCEAADYPSEASACEGQKLGGAKVPLAPPSPLPSRFRRPCIIIQGYVGSSNSGNDGVCSTEPTNVGNFSF